YGARPVPAEAPAGSPLTRAARQDLYQDAVNESLFMRPSQYLTRAMVFADGTVVDGFVRGIARSTAGLGSSLRRAQTGYVRSYAAMMLGGVVLALVVVLATRVSWGGWPRDEWSRSDGPVADRAHRGAPGGRCAAV